MTEQPSSEHRIAAESFLALAADWDERLCREYGVTGYTDWHSEEVRSLVAKHVDAHRAADTSKRCFCGGEVGPRVPGDADGLGCLDDINHAWSGTTETDQSRFNPAHVSAYAAASRRVESMIEAEVQRRTAAAVSDLRWKIHAIRFAKEEGTLEGPDNFYNGVITAEAIARDHIPAPSADLDGAARTQSDAISRIADLVAPGWRPNLGHQHDSTTEAYAAGRNEIIDAVREILADGKD